MNKLFVRALIRHHTRLCRDHMTPELALNLITKDCPAWAGNYSESPFEDPFWAFYWPGGQALTRYILDNPSVFHKKTLLDIGSGCGSASIAAKLVGASVVVANDIDPVAGVAIEMNAEVNRVQLSVEIANRLASPARQTIQRSSSSDTESSDPVASSNKEFWDFILIGDMFYDPDFADLIWDWVDNLNLNTQSLTTVLIGDPGRLAFNSHNLKHSLSRLAQYDLSTTSILENNGLTEASVWKLNR